MNKHINNFKSFSKRIEILDENLMERYDNLINNLDKIDESVFGNLFKKAKKGVSNWAIKGPKIKKLQTKANEEKLKAVKVQIEIRNKVEDLLKDDKAIDVERIMSVMKKQVKIHLNNASKHEEQVNKIVDEDPYLEKIQNALKYKGELDRNSLLMTKASKEEEFELDDENEDIRDKLEITMDEFEEGIKTGEMPTDNSEKGRIKQVDNLMNKAKKRMDRAGLSEEELEKANRGFDLFMRSLIGEIIDERSGKKQRKSSNTKYRMIDDMMTLIEKEKISLSQAFERLSKKYEKEGLLRDKDKIMKDKVNK